MSACSLPIIDISALYTENKDAALDVARQLDDACRVWGFFYITGHNISKERIAALTEIAHKFFDSPME